MLQKGEDDAAALGGATFTNLSLDDGIDGSALTNCETNNRHETRAIQRHRLPQHCRMTASLPSDIEKGRKGRRGGIERERGGG